MHLKVACPIKQSPNRIMCCKTIAQQTKKNVLNLRLCFLKKLSPLCQAILWAVCKYVPLRVCRWCYFPYWFTSLLSQTLEGLQTKTLHLYYPPFPKALQVSPHPSIQDKSSGFKPLGQNMLYTYNGRERKKRVFCSCL